MLSASVWLPQMYMGALVAAWLCILKLRNLDLKIKRPGIMLCMHPADGGWRYIVTSSPVGWVHAQSDPYKASAVCDKGLILYSTKYHVHLRVQGEQLYEILLHIIGCTGLTHWGWVSIGLGDGLVSSGNKPWPGLVLTWKTNNP